MKKCVKCDSMIVDGAVFCPYCGQKQPSEEPTNDNYGFCPYCGSRIGKELAFCTNCGKKLADPGTTPGVWETPGFEEEPAYREEPVYREEPAYREEPVYREEPAYREESDVPLLLKIAGIVFGAVFALFALGYLAYLGYAYFSFKLVGLLQIVAYGWSALILFLLAFKGRRENGIYLLCGLFLGGAAACILHIINLAMSSSHYGYGNAGIGRFIFTIIAVAVITYVMYNEHLLIPLEDCGSAADILKTIPGIVFEALPRNMGSTGKQTVRQEYGAVGRDDYAYVESGGIQVRLASAGGSVWTLILCVIFTLTQIYEVYTYFSLVTVIGHLVSLVLCVGMWCVYVSCRSGSMVTAGFTMISVAMTIELVIQCVLALVLAYLGVMLIKNDEGEAGITVLIFAVLMVLYWISLWKTAHTASLAAKGLREKIHASLFPVVILGLSVIWRTIILGVAVYIQSKFGDVMNSFSELVSMFGDWTDALGALGSYGLEYSGYGEVSRAFSLLNDLGEAFIAWIRVVLGIQDSFFAMILGIAMPVCCIALLLKARRLRHAR